MALVALLVALPVIAGTTSRPPTAVLDSAASPFSGATTRMETVRRAWADARPPAPSPASPAGTPFADTGSAPSAVVGPPAPAPAQDQGTVEPSSQGIVVTVPTTIAADCSQDVTGALNAWMKSVADGSTLLFQAGACYRIDGTLVLSDRRDLALDGNGAAFAASLVPPATPKITRQMWSMVGGSGITIKNMTIRGTNPVAVFDVRREWFPLIQIAGTTGVLVQGVSGSNSWGDFVSIGPDVRRVTNSDGTGGVLARDVTIRGSSASVIGRHGVTCNGCEDVRIDGNAFSDVAYQVLDIEVEADTWHARDVAFTNNTIGGTVKLSVLANAGIGRDVTGITVSGNTMTGTPVTCAPPIQVDDTSAVKSDFVITDNRFKTLGNAFRLHGVSNVAVENNTVTFGEAGCTNSGVAVIASAAYGSVVRNNDFIGARAVIQAGTTATGTACGNRLTGTEFDRPERCDTP